MEYTIIYVLLVSLTVYAMNYVVYYIILCPLGWFHFIHYSKIGFVDFRNGLRFGARNHSETEISNKQTQFNPAANPAFNLIRNSLMKFKKRNGELIQFSFSFSSEIFVDRS